jgi:hypothetical protein
MIESLWVKIAIPGVIVGRFVASMKELRAEYGGRPVACPRLFAFGMSALDWWLVLFKVLFRR